MTIKNYIFKNVRLDENKYGGFKTEGEIFSENDDISVRFVLRVSKEEFYLDIKPTDPTLTLDPQMLCRFAKVVASKVIK